MTLRSSRLVSRINALAPGDDGYGLRSAALKDVVADPNPDP